MYSSRFLRGILTAAILALAGATSAQAANVLLRVVAARNEPALPSGTNNCTPSATQICKGTTVIGTYKFLVNVDNTGQTATQRSPAVGSGCSTQDAGYPDSCLWTSIAGTPSHSPVYTQGSNADMAAQLTGVPDGRYLVSVLADGYKLDGRHFTVAGTTVKWEGKPAADPAGRVTVEMQPFPLPDAQIQAAVFEDISPVNSAPDVPAEHGLAGFQGHITDYLGEVTTDVYGAPLCGSGRCLSKCYVVDGGVDIGIVRPDGWIDPNTPSASGFGRCPIAIINDETGLLDPVIKMFDLNGVACTGAANSCPVEVPVTAEIEGKVKIPNLGPNRYALSVTQPDGSGWVQTTTLEGNHDWDAWVMEGATGLDTEFMIAGEPFPAIIFGYVPVAGTPSGVGSPVATPLNGTGTIKGIVEAVKVYVPASGGVGGLPGEIWGGMQGAKLDKPVEHPWVTLTNLGDGDTIVWAGQGAVDGTFTIPNVPAGTYTLTWWDEPQNEILDLVNLTIGDGETVDMGILPLAGWWTYFDGYVFNDTNRNGIKDAGEPGLAGYTLTMRKRENSLMDRGTTSASTDANGYYKFEAAYPMTQWLVLEAYDDLHFTTGITYQADNQPTPTTIIGAGVDVSVHPIIGLSGRVDWGKRSYDATGSGGIDPRNGGIVGTVSYDTTRNELDPRYAAVEDWQPSISDLMVNLYATVPAPVPCVRQPAAGATCDPTGRYALDSDGSIMRGALLNNYLSETWQRPTNCVVRNMDGTELVHGVDEQVLPLDPNARCIEAPLTGIQIAPYETDQGTPDANFGAAVDGNYGFGDGCFVGTPPGALTPGVFDPVTSSCTVGTLQALPPRDYLVQVDLKSQLDTNPVVASRKPIYKVTREEDINIGNGDQFVPAVPPSACAGALHTVNSTGNANFPGGPGHSPYEGLAEPLCDVKLVTVSNGKSIAPSFNLYTDVPLPSRHWFIVIDDLNFSSNPKSVTYGEKAGMPFVPIGIYDYTDRLIKTVESDYNGLADVLLPSTNRINCPTPSGVCANLYRYVGNDPGVPGRLNANFDPNYRTIAAEFEALPGLLVPADLAPTQVGVTVQLPGGQTTSPVQCKVDDTTPELYRVNQPYATRPNNGAVAITISGRGFGATKGTGQVVLDAANVTTTSWTDTQIVASITAATAIGPHELRIRSANGQTTVNGLTFHVLGTGYNPQLYRVGPGLTGARTYQPAETLPVAADHAIQNALDDAATYVGGAANRSALVVVFPNDPSVDPRQNPRGAYYENLIITSRVKLQGVGPGSPDGSVRGSIIDGGAFAGDSPVATDWYARMDQQAIVDADNNLIPLWSGNTTIYDGAVISIYVPSTTFDLPGVITNAVRTSIQRRAFPTTYSAITAPSVDGFDLRGGDQQGFPGNINAIGGQRTGQPGGLITQGGAIYANAYANNLQITNNLVRNNGGAYGSIRIGTPDAGDNNNRNVVIAYNRITANAGTNLAGGIGLFEGARNYQVSFNDICGNFSAEYGGGISAIGMNYDRASAYSATTNFGGRINNNRIYFNRSYDEGGGVMIAGALPATTTTLSPGSGPVDIYNNLIQANLSNDDGGGLRFLMAGNFPMNVYNNMIVNNISTHEGGGIALNDAPNVRVFNNTIMKNLTTATAITSNGAAAPAGLATSANSNLLQATLPAASPAFSNPLLFNNIFWDNRAGTRTLTGVTGLGTLADCTAGCDYWDLGIADAIPGALAPTNSVVQQTAHAFTPSATNQTVTPNVISPYDVGVTFNSWRNNPAFLGAIMISADLPPELMGDYHITNISPAFNLGAANKAVPGYQGGGNRAAPTNDIDGEGRPALGGYDTGADEVTSTTANLGITKTDGVTTLNRGQAVTYTIVVTNAGPGAVAGAPVTDTIPAALTGATWTCVASRFSSCGAASGTGNIATTVNLANGGTATFTLKATVGPTALGTLVNTATVAIPAGMTDPVAANNSATDTDTVLVPVDLSITKTDGLTTVSRGTQIRYTIVVSNTGANAVTGATVADPFPAVLTGPVNWTCATTGGATCGGAATGTGNIARTVNMPAGSTITFLTTSGSVSATTLLTTMVNTATVALPAGFTDATPLDNSATDTDTIVLPLPDLAISVTDGQTSVSRGQQVRYTIVAVNNGPATVTGARVADTFPTALTGTINWTCTTTGGATCGGGGGGGGGATGNGTINRLVNMPAGSTVTFTTTSGSVSNTTAATTLVNTATVTGPAGFVDSVPANNTATDTDTIGPVHVFAISGTGANISGTQWTATITVTAHNASHQLAAGVLVTGTWTRPDGSTVTTANTCTTGANGQCQLTRSQQRNNANGATVRYTVNTLTSVAAGYNAAANEVVPATVLVARP